MSDRIQKQAAPSGVKDEATEVENPAYYEYAWAGTAEQIASLIETLPIGSAVLPVWTGQPFEHYPPGAVVRFRSPEPVKQPEWASRVDPAVARGTVGVFA